MKLEGIRRDIVKVCKDLYRNNLVRYTGTGGNVSVRDKNSGLIVVTPSQVRYDTMSPEELVVVTVDGEIVDKKKGREPTSESTTHRLIYDSFPDINAVIHTHSTYANVLASVYSEIPAVHTEFAYFIGSKIPVTKWTNPGSQKMAEEVVKHLREYPATVLRNHGPITIGADLKLALDRSLAVEDSSKIYYNALSLGEPAVISEKQTDQVKKG